MARRILVADDEAFLTQILKASLQKRGFEVMVASNGEIAYDAAVRHIPDLIVSDFQMPVLDGLGLCMRLKQNSQTNKIPVLMLTARGHILAPEQIAQTSIRAVLSKPFSANQLFARIEETLTCETSAKRAAG